ncbi:MAG: extracellular matrix regulator RemB [Oscillospiraceae bacterium]
MYLHLGQETMVKTRDIVGIFDLDTSSLSKKTREYLALAQKEGRVVNISTELPKSFIVTANGAGSIYISQLSAATLKGRAEQLHRRRFK